VRSVKFSRRTLAALIFIFGHAAYAQSQTLNAQGASGATPQTGGVDGPSKSRLVQVRPKGAKIAAPKARLIRYNGSAGWSLADIEKVKGFFRARFGRELPISAFGQTASHNRLRFNHSQAVDVAVHPRSAEGRALAEYLRGEGIPFIAITGAIAGSATGPHIHIGKPSPRM
jgi:hypothetical protein